MKWDEELVMKGRGEKTREDGIQKNKSTDPFFLSCLPFLPVCDISSLAPGSDAVSSESLSGTTHPTKQLSQAPAILHSVPTYSLQTRNMGDRANVSLYLEHVGSWNNLP